MSAGGTTTVDAHLARILDAIAPLPPAHLPLLDALGLVAAESVHAGVALPGFDNSAMDGYAVRHADVVAATAEAPVHLPVVGEIGAGSGTALHLEPGTAAKIMTGAPIPPGADAVVPYEWTDRGVGEVVISTAPELGQHVRPLGDDVAVGDLLVEAGTVLTPRHLGLLAAVGQAGVRVHPRPRVVVISTGAELRDPGQELAPDALYDANSYLLAAGVRDVGAIAYRVGIVSDQVDVFAKTLDEQLVRADVVVTSGGVSMGDYDVVKEALAPLGTVWFGPVAMQPGKPQGFGVVGDDAVPIFTLPGNPVSSYLSFELFVKPALRRMMGIEPAVPAPARARLTHDLTSPPGRRQFLRASYDAASGVVSPVGGAGSHLVGDMAAADALIVVDDDETAVAAGATVEVIVLEGR